MKYMVCFLGIIFIMACTTAVWAGDSPYPPASADGYYDIATGHKYIKNQDSTYTEYSKRGKLLRADVPSTSSLLVSGKYIYEMTDSHYLVYEKRQNNTVTQQVLPASSNHPEGWRCKHMLSRIQGNEMSIAEAYEAAK
ncbi:MAG: hypothetical protein HUN04_24930 [Desulfobacter sp.]|nr:MAG: hypothetical protein HUN04_24930 [Desulfobacter sp.]